MDCFSVMMEHRVDAYPPVVSRDAGGGSALSFPTARDTGIACLINAPMLSATDRFSQDNLVGAVTIATFTSTIARGDKLVVTAGGPYVGASLHVTGIKRQPGVAALGFSDLYHIQAEHVA